MTRDNLEECELKRKISNFLLNDIKMKYTSIGFNYWINAIGYYILLKQKDKYAPIRLEEIYKYLSKKYNTTRDRVEKVMRYARENSEYQKELQVNRKVKNKEFLIVCAERFLI